LSQHAAVFSVSNFEVVDRVFGGRSSLDYCAPVGDRSETQMNVRTSRWLLVTVFMLVAVVGCSPAATPSSPTSPTTSASQPPIDYVALEAEIEKAITTGPARLDKVRAVLVNVDGETKIAHYRSGFTEDDHGHVFSVTKRVVSILIGIAIADGLIADIDQPLSALLPKHREAMSGNTATVTLRQLMSMSGGFNNEFPGGGFVWEKYAEPGGSFVEGLLERRQELEPGKVFWYSDISAHLVASVLAAALERADGDRPRTVLDYAREKLFDPLGISTRPAFSEALPDVFAPKFVTAGFGWGTDPNGIQLGGFGLRLTAPDMMKIGELYRRDGVWKGQQIVPSDSGHIAKAMRDIDDEAGKNDWVRAVVDVPGVGGGVVDRLAELELRVVPYNGGEAPRDKERFVNARAEDFWTLRERFEQGEIDIDPDDDKLAAQLGSIKWDIDSRGRIKIESKDDMRKRGLPSPDRADAMAIAFAGRANAAPMNVESHAGESLTGDLMTKAW
jgi:CubicO group peptidase (beta-lactamase class C family)